MVEKIISIMWNMIFQKFFTDEVTAPLPLPIKKIFIVTNLSKISQRRYDQQKEHIQIVQTAEYKFYKNYG